MSNPRPVIEDLSTATQEEIDQFLIRMIAEWWQFKFRDEILREVFKEEFKNREKIHIDKATANQRRDFRNNLVSNGVYMTPTPAGSHGNVSSQLMEALSTHIYHEWRDEEFYSWALNSNGRVRIEINSAFNPRDPAYHGFDMQKDDDKMKEDNAKYNAKKGKEIDRRYGTSRKIFNRKDNEQEKDEFTKEEEEGGDKERQEKSFSRPLRDEPWEVRHQPKNKQLESLARLYKESDKYADGLDSFVSDT